MEILNPYKFMLSLRDNKILFQYLTNVSVSYDDRRDWLISSITEYGYIEIYQTKSNVLRFILPISVPNFINIGMLQNLITPLQESIEGVISICEVDTLYLDYYIHIPVENWESNLSTALIEFVQDRENIKEGFKQIKKELNRIQDFSNEIKGEEDNSSADSLWNDISEIDKQFENFDKLDNENLDQE